MHALSNRRNRPKAKPTLCNGLYINPSAKEHYSELHAKHGWHRLYLRSEMKVIDKGKLLNLLAVGRRLVFERVPHAIGALIAIMLDANQRICEHKTCFLIVA